MFGQLLDEREPWAGHPSLRIDRFLLLLSALVDVAVAVVGFISANANIINERE